jgi:hypothetical protein
VVVAIIAVLIAMLMPALSQARQAAKLVVCSSQLHQLGMALSSYAFENSDKYPPGNSCNFPYLRFRCRNAADTSFMGNLLLKYVGKKYAMFYCPAANPFTFSSACMASLLSAPNNGTFFLSGLGGEPGYDVYMGYMYFGNYAEDFPLLWPYPGGWVVDRFPTGPSGDRKKVMQDITTSLSQDLKLTSVLNANDYYVNHDTPNSLYTDGSVVGRSRDKLTTDGLTRVWGSEIYYVDK